MIEQTILAHLLYDEPYARKVLPFLKPEYFEDFATRQNKLLFEIVSDYAVKYGKVPTLEAIFVEVDARKFPSDELAKATVDLARSLKHDPETSQEWLIKRTEDFCKRKAAYGVTMRAHEMIANGEVPLDAMHDLWKGALSISFDPDLGHDYLEDAEKRYEAYKKQTRRIPFDIPILNKITRGGLPNKSLSVIMAPTGVGKSQVMSHLAAAQLMMGKNVLYITLELSAIEQVGERIDANLMGIETRQVEGLSKDVFMSKIGGLARKTAGKLLLKEYPTGSAGAHHFRNYINELRLKKGCQPDVVYVDYINLCCSSRLRGSGDANSYTIIKMIAEELRGLAMEFDVPVVTATQTNRQGFNNSEIELTDTAESIGLPQTADFMIALISTPEFESKGQLLFKQLKNRWCGTTDWNKFVLGIDRSRMRLHEIAENAQMFNTPLRRPERLNFEGNDFK